jgi:hypothetical protein
MELRVKDFRVGGGSVGVQKVRCKRDHYECKFRRLRQLMTSDVKRGATAHPVNKATESKTANNRWITSAPFVR